MEYVKESILNLKLNDNYMLLERIGKGAFSNVYKVIKLENKQIFALKLTLLKDSNKEILYKIHRLKHDNIIKIEEEFNINIECAEFFQSNEPYKCIILEFCEKDLKKKIDEKKENNSEFDFETIYLWAKELIYGLSFLHKNKIIHRDIKPDNILIKGNQIKIADFTVAVIANDTNVYGEFGTHDYKSPEMISGKTYNSKTDIWSLGCVLFELITLICFNSYINLHEQDHLVKKAFKRLIPEQLDTLVKKMLLRESELRSDSASLEKHLKSIKNKPLIAKKILTCWSIDFDKLPKSKLEKSNKRFLKRKHILDEIESIFQNKKILVLYSCEGTGKSVIANQFGHEFEKNPNRFVYTMNASKTHLESNLIDFTKENFQNSNFTDIKDVFKWFNAILNEKTKILFIFDDCKADSDIESLLKHSLYINLKNVYFLITTRNNNLIKCINQEHFVNYELSFFNKNDALQYFELNFKNENQTCLIELLDEILGKNNEIRPSILDRCLLFIKLNNQIDLTKMIQLFKSSTAYKNSIQETKLFKDIFFYNRLAWEILRYSSYLDSDFIPIKILSKLIKIESKELIESINFLKSLSIVNSVQKTEIGLKIHPTLKYELIDYLNDYDTEYKSLKENFIFLIDQIYSNEKDNWSRNKLYFNNIVLITELVLKCIDSNCKEIYLIYFNFAEFYSFWGKYNEALEYYELCVTSNAFSNEISIQNILYKIGKICIDIGKYDLALKYFNKSLENNSNESYLAKILSDIALIYYNQTKYEMALHYYEESLIIKKNMINFNSDLSVADNLNNMGMIYDQLGKHDTALEYFTKSFQIYKTNFTECDPNVLNNIASIYFNQAKYELALNFYEEAFKIYKNTYDENSTTIAICIQKIGNANRELGDNFAALRNFEKSLEIFNKNCVGNETIEISNLLNDIGSVYDSLGNFKIALENYEKSLCLKRKILNNDSNPEIATLLNNIGVIYVKLNEEDKALEYFSKALEINENIFDYENISIAEILSNMGNVYQGKNKSNLALTCYVKSLSIVQKLLDNQNNQVSIYKMNRKQYDLSLDCYSNSIGFIKSYFFNKNSKALNIVNEIENTYNPEKSMELELNYLKKLIEINKDLLETDNVESSLFVDYIIEVGDNLDLNQNSFKQEADEFKIQLSKQSQNESIHSKAEILNSENETASTNEAPYLERRMHYFSNEKYTLLDNIGNGRFGAVYKIIDNKNQVY